MLAYALQLREAGQDKEALAAVLNHLGCTQRRDSETTPPGSAQNTPRSRRGTPRGENDDSLVASQTQLALLGVELCNQLADRSLAAKMGSQGLDYCGKGEGICDTVWRLRGGGPWWHDARWAAVRCRCLFNAAESFKMSSKTKKEPDATELLEVLRRLCECEEIQQRWPSSVEQPESLQLCLAETHWRVGNYKAAEASCKKALTLLGVQERERLDAAGAHAVMLALWISANVAFETNRHGEVAEIVQLARSTNTDCLDEETKFRVGRVLTRIERLGRQSILAQTDGTCAMVTACLSPRSAPVGSGVAAVRRQRSVQDMAIRHDSETSASPSTAARAPQRVASREALSATDARNRSGAPLSSIDPRSRDRSVSPRCTPRCTPPVSPRTSATQKRYRDASVSPRYTPPISPRTFPMQKNFIDASVSPRCSTPVSPGNFSSQRCFKDASVSPRRTPPVSPRTFSMQKNFRDAGVSPRTTPAVSPNLRTSSTERSLRLGPLRDASVSPRTTPPVSPRMIAREAIQNCERRMKQFRDASASPRRPSHSTTPSVSPRAVTPRSAFADHSCNDVGTQVGMNFVDDEADVIEDFLANQEDVAIDTFLAGTNIGLDHAGKRGVVACTDDENEHGWDAFVEAISSVGHESAPGQRTSPALPREQSTAPGSRGLSPRRPITPRRSPKRPPQPVRPVSSWSPTMWDGTESEASTELPGLSHATSASSLPQARDRHTGSCRSDTPRSALGIDPAHANFGLQSRSITPTQRSRPPKARPPPLHMARSRSSTPPPQTDRLHARSRAMDGAATERRQWSPVQKTPQGPPPGLLEDLQDFMRKYEGGVAEPEPAPQQTPVGTYFESPPWDLPNNAAENLLHEVLEELCNQPRRILAAENRFESPRHNASPRLMQSISPSRDAKFDNSVPGLETPRYHVPLPDGVTDWEPPYRHVPVQDTSAELQAPQYHHVPLQDTAAEVQVPQYHVNLQDLVAELEIPMTAIAETNPGRVQHLTEGISSPKAQLSTGYLPQRLELVESPIAERTYEGTCGADSSNATFPAAGAISLGSQNDAVTGSQGHKNSIEASQDAVGQGPVSIGQEDAEGHIGDAASDVVLHSDMGSKARDGSETPDAMKVLDLGLAAPHSNSVYLDGTDSGQVETLCTLCHFSPAQSGFEWCSHCAVLEVVCPLCKRSLTFGEMHVHLLACRPAPVEIAEPSTKSSSASRPASPAAAKPQAERTSNAQAQRITPQRPALRAGRDNMAAQKVTPKTGNSMQSRNPVISQSLNPGIPEYFREQMNPQNQILTASPKASPEQAKARVKRPVTPKTRPPPLVSSTPAHMPTATASRSKVRSATVSPKSKTTKERAEVSTAKHDPFVTQAPTPPLIPTKPPSPPKVRSARVSPRSKSSKDHANLSMTKLENVPSQPPTPIALLSRPPPPPPSVDQCTKGAVMEAPRQAQLQPGIAPWRPAGGSEKLAEVVAESDQVVEVLHKRLRDAQAAAAAAAAEDTQQPRGSMAWAYRGVRSQMTPPHLVRGIFTPKGGSRRSSPRSAGPTTPRATSPH